MTQKIFAVVVIALAALNAAGAEEKNLDMPASLKPFLNEQTVALVGIDLEKFDWTALQKQYLDPLARTDADRISLSVTMGQLQQWSKQLQADGSRQIFLVVTTERLQVPLPKRDVDRVELDLLAQTTFLVLPSVSQQTREDLRKAVANAQIPVSQGYKFYSVGPKLQEINQATIIAFDELSETLKSMRPSPRPEFAKAWVAATNSPMRIAVVAPPIFSRAAREILIEPLPGMKQPMGPILADGAKWVSAGVEPNLDRFSARLTIQSADAESAQSLASLLRQTVMLVGSKLVEQGEWKHLLDAALLTALLPQSEGDRLVLSLDEKQAADLRQFVQAAFRVAMAKTFRHQSKNNLKQIALAMHNNHSARKQLPDRAIRDKDGKPLLSWRVAILPYLEGNKLYQEFHLDEPWDSEHNRKLIEKMPAPYQSPDTAHLHPGCTRYLAPVGENLAFPPDRGIPLKEFTDGTSATILVVEADADHAVIWTKPDDIEIDLNDPKRGLTDGKKSFNAARADGSAHVVPGNIEPETLRRLFTRNGSEPVDR